MTYDPKKPLWDQVKIDPKLREFIAVSPADVTHLTIEAMRKTNPAAFLTETLNNRGLAKKSEIEEHNQRRREEDAAFIRDVHKWPSVTTIRIKEQPWIKTNGRRFGHLALVNVVTDEWVAYPDGEDEERYASLEDLVEVWSVD